MATVTVGCKIPNGLILRNFVMQKVNEARAGGGFMEIERAVLVGGTVEIKGPAVRVGESSPTVVVNGAALTHGVDADFFNAWLLANKDSAMVQNHMVFAHEKHEQVTARAREFKGELSGLQPIVPNSDKRLPRSSSNVAVSTADAA